MIYIENYIPVIKYNGLNTEKDVNISGASTLSGVTIISGATTLAGATSITGTLTITGTPLSTAGTIYPMTPINATVVAKTTTGNLAAGDMKKNITNTGAGAGIVLTLLAAATAGVTCFRVQVTAAQTITLTPQAGEKIYLGGDGVASKYALIAGVIGNYVNVYCDGTSYYITNYSGIVTKEA